MHPSQRPPPSCPSQARLGPVLLVIVSALHFGPAAPAQERDPPILRLSGVLPGGVRATATESWGVFEFGLTNFADVDRQARVVTFYEGQPDVRYGRDIWVPARSALSSWLLVGPAAPQRPRSSRDIQMLLYDRSQGEDRLILPRTEERIRTRPITYRKRESTSTILLDEELPPPAFGELPRPESRADQAHTLVRAFRLTRSLSEAVPLLQPGLLPPLPEAFDGLDHFVIASRRIADDPAGTRALRQWLQRGGKVWVMLDLVDVEDVASLLGDARDFEVVDRVGLTRFDIMTQSAGRREVAPIHQDHDRPVEFARVMLPRHEQPRHTIDGWPVWFTRQVGRGRILFTTLGGPGWYRPRTGRDQTSPFKSFPSMPVPLDHLAMAGDEMERPTEDSAFAVDAFRESLNAEIGYSVIGRRTAAALFGAFLLTTLGLGIVLRRSRRPEWLGWLGPAAALMAAGVFVALGQASRQAVPATVAVGQVVDAGLDGREAAVRGLLAVYRPESGQASVAVEQGGMIRPELKGLGNPSRRLILTDLGAWHVDQLSLPAGVRLASFEYTAPTSEPITAVARFGPRGVEGRLKAGPFQGPTDAVIHPAAGRNLAAHLGPDGTFTANPSDTLPAGQFLAGTLLDDRQQRRQGLYRDFLKRPTGGLWSNRNLLLAWARPLDMRFTLAPDARTVGSALLVVPLQLERPEPGKRVTIPGPFVPFSRMVNEANIRRPNMTGSESTDMHLRFQLPPAVLPFGVERARLQTRIDAPGRRVTIGGPASSGRVEIHRVESPLGPLRIDVSDERLLRLDEEGGLHLHVALGDLKKEEAGQESLRDEKWTIRYLELEVTGRALPEK